MSGVNVGISGDPEDMYKRAYTRQEGAISTTILRCKKASWSDHGRKYREKMRRPDEGPLLNTSDTLGSLSPGTWRFL